MQSWQSRVNDNPTVARIRRFFYSRWYPAAVAAVTLVSYVTGWEFFCAFITVTAACASMLLCRDLLPVLPPTVCLTFSVSLMHAPQRPTYSDYLFSGGRLVLVLILAGMVVLSYAARLMLWGFRLPENTGKPALGWALLPLALALCLNGAGRSGYSVKNLVFGVITAFCWCFLYLAYVGGFPRGRAAREYFFDTCFWVAWLLMAELAFAYVYGNVIVDGAVVSSRILVGWGIHNNIGAMLALLIPPVFYLAATRREGWLYYLTGVSLLVSIVMTTSRGSLLVGGAVFLACTVTVCIWGEHRREFRIAAAVLALAAVCLIVFHEPISAFLPRFKNEGMNDNGRFDLWRSGWEQFLEAPLFGVGFSAIRFHSYAGKLFPGYLHNTPIELLAAGGVFALVSYLAYRVKTVLLFVRMPTVVRLFLALSVVALLGTSLLDNHVFNIYPMFFYAAALALAEHDLTEQT